MHPSSAQFGSKRRQSAAQEAGLSRSMEPPLKKRPVGRPAKPLNPSINRLVVRLMRRTNVPIDVVTNAIHKEGSCGITTQTIRKRLTDLLGLDHRDELTLNDIRPLSTFTGEVRDGAAQIYSLDMTDLSDDRNTAAQAKFHPVFDIGRSSSPTEHGPHSEEPWWSDGTSQTMVESASPTPTSHFPLGVDLDTQSSGQPDDELFDFERYFAEAGPYSTANKVPPDLNMETSSLVQSIFCDRVPQRTVSRVLNWISSNWNSKKNNSTFRAWLVLVGKHASATAMPRRTCICDGPCTSPVDDPEIDDYYGGQCHSKIASFSSEPTRCELLILLMRAHQDGEHDDTVEERLIDWFRRDQSQEQKLMTEADENGVTPLFLAVAYGYSRVCRLLLQSAPNLRHRLNNRNVCAYHWCKRAPRLAMDDMELYARIVACREMARTGHLPGCSNKKPNRRAMTSVPSHPQQRQPGLGARNIPTTYGPDTVIPAAHPALRALRPAPHPNSEPAPKHHQPLVGYHTDSTLGGSISLWGPARLMTESPSPWQSSDNLGFTGPHLPHVNHSSALRPSGTVSRPLVVVREPGAETRVSLPHQLALRKRQLQMVTYANPSQSRVGQNVNTSINHSLWENRANMLQAGPTSDSGYTSESTASSPPAFVYVQGSSAPQAAGCSTSISTPSNTTLQDGQCYPLHSSTRVRENEERQATASPATYSHHPGK